MRPRLSSASQMRRRIRCRAKPLDASGGGVLTLGATPPPLIISRHCVTRSGAGSRTPRMSYIALLYLALPTLVPRAGRKRARDVTHGVLSSPLKGEEVRDAAMTTLRELRGDDGRWQRPLTYPGFGPACERPYTDGNAHSIVNAGSAELRRLRL